jgi:hypothetical protein
MASSSSGCKPRLLAIAFWLARSVPLNQFAWRASRILACVRPLASVPVLGGASVVTTALIPAKLIRFAPPSKTLVASTRPKAAVPRPTGNPACVLFRASWRNESH